MTANSLVRKKLHLNARYVVIKEGSYLVSRGIARRHSEHLPDRCPDLLVGPKGDGAAVRKGPPPRNSLFGSSLRYSYPLPSRTIGSCACNWPIAVS